MATEQPAYLLDEQPLNLDGAPVVAARKSGTSGTAKVKPRADADAGDAGDPVLNLMDNPAPGSSKTKKASASGSVAPASAAKAEDAPQSGAQASIPGVRAGAKPTTAALHGLVQGLAHRFSRDGVEGELRRNVESQLQRYAGDVVLYAHNADRYRDLQRAKLLPSQQWQELKNKRGELERRAREVVDREGDRLLKQYGRRPLAERALLGLGAITRTEKELDRALEALRHLPNFPSRASFLELARGLRPTQVARVASSFMHGPAHAIDTFRNVREEREAESNIRRRLHLDELRALWTKRSPEIVALFERITRDWSPMQQAALRRALQAGKGVGEVYGEAVAKNAQARVASLTAAMARFAHEWDLARDPSVTTPLQEPGMRAAPVESQTQGEQSGWQETIDAPVDAAPLDLSDALDDGAEDDDDADEILVGEVDDVNEDADDENDDEDTDAAAPVAHAGRVVSPGPSPARVFGGPPRPGTMTADGHVPFHDLTRGLGHERFRELGDRYGRQPWDVYHDALVGAQGDALESREAMFMDLLSDANCDPDGACSINPDALATFGDLIAGYTPEQRARITAALVEGQGTPLAVFRECEYENQRDHQQLADPAFVAYEGERGRAGWQNPVHFWRAAHYAREAGDVGEAGDGGLPGLPDLSALAPFAQKAFQTLTGQAPPPPAARPAVPGVVAPGPGPGFVPDLASLSPALKALQKVLGGGDAGEAAGIFDMMTPEQLIPFSKVALKYIGVDGVRQILEAVGKGEGPRNALRPLGKTILAALEGALPDDNLATRVIVLMGGVDGCWKLLRAIDGTDPSPKGLTPYAQRVLNVLQDKDDTGEAGEPDETGYGAIGGGGVSFSRERRGERFGRERRGREREFEREIEREHEHLDLLGERRHERRHRGDEYAPRPHGERGPSGAGSAFPENTLIQSSAGYVYVMRGGRRHWIKDPATASAMGLDLGTVQTIDQGLLRSIPRGRMFILTADRGVIETEEHGADAGDPEDEAGAIGRRSPSPLRVVPSTLPPSSRMADQAAQAERIIARADRRAGLGAPARDNRDHERAYGAFHGDRNARLRLLDGERVHGVSLGELADRGHFGERFRGEGGGERFAREYGRRYGTYGGHERFLRERDAFGRHGFGEGEREYAPRRGAAFPENTLIQSSAGYVYVMRGGRRHWIKDPATASAMGLDLGTVQTIDQGLLRSIPRGRMFILTADRGVIETEEHGADAGDPEDEAADGETCGVGDVLLAIATGGLSTAVKFAGHAAQKANHLSAVVGEMQNRPEYAPQLADWRRRYGVEWWRHPEFRRSWRTRYGQEFWGHPEYRAVRGLRRVREVAGPDEAGSLVSDYRALEGFRYNPRIRRLLLDGGNVDGTTLNGLLARGYLRAEGYEAAGPDAPANAKGAIAMTGAGTRLLNKGADDDGEAGALLGDYRALYSFRHSPRARRWLFEGNPIDGVRLEDLIDRGYLRRVIAESAGPEAVAALEITNEGQSLLRGETSGTDTGAPFVPTITNDMLLEFAPQALANLGNVAGLRKMMRAIGGEPIADLSSQQKKAVDAVCGTANGDQEGIGRVVQVYSALGREAGCKALITSIEGGKAADGLTPFGRRVFAALNGTLPPGSGTGGTDTGTAPYGEGDEVRDVPPGPIGLGDEERPTGSGPRPIGAGDFVWGGPGTDAGDIEAQPMEERPRPFFHLQFPPMTKVALQRLLEIVPTLQNEPEGVIAELASLRSQANDVSGVDGTTGEYLCEPGETYETIAYKLTGDPLRAREIRAANPAHNPRDARLRLPPGWFQYLHFATSANAADESGCASPDGDTGRIEPVNLDVAYWTHPGYGRFGGSMGPWYGRVHGHWGNPNAGYGAFAQSGGAVGSGRFYFPSRDWSIPSSYDWGWAPREADFTYEDWKNQDRRPAGRDVQGLETGDAASDYTRRQLQAEVNAARAALQSATGLAAVDAQNRVRNAEDALASFTARNADVGGLPGDSLGLDNQPLALVVLLRQINKAYPERDRGGLTGDDGFVDNGMTLQILDDPRMQDGSRVGPDILELQRVLKRDPRIASTDVGAKGTTTFLRITVKPSAANDAAAWDFAGLKQPVSAPQGGGETGYGGIGGSNTTVTFRRPYVRFEPRFEREILVDRLDRRMRPSWHRPRGERIEILDWARGSERIPWVSTTNGGAEIWDGYRWIPNTRLVAGVSMRGGGAEIWDGNQWVSNVYDDDDAGSPDDVPMAAPPGDKSKLLSIVITDPDGKAIPNARVTWQKRGQDIPAGLTANAKGQIALQNWGPGTFLVNVEAPGYTVPRQEITVGSNGGTFIIAMDPVGGESGSPDAGALWSEGGGHGHLWHLDGLRRDRWMGVEGGIGPATIAVDATVFARPNRLSMSEGMLPGGTEVRVIERIGPWLHVFPLGGGPTGWVLEETATECADTGEVFGESTRDALREFMADPESERILATVLTELAKNPWVLREIAKGGSVENATIADIEAAVKRLAKRAAVEQALDLGLDDDAGDAGEAGAVRRAAKKSRGGAHGAHGAHGGHKHDKHHKKQNQQQQQQQQQDQGGGGGGDQGGGGGGGGDQGGGGGGDGTDVNLNLMGDEPETPETPETPDAKDASGPNLRIAGEQLDPSTLFSAPAVARAVQTPAPDEGLWGGFKRFIGLAGDTSGPSGSLRSYVAIGGETPQSIAQHFDALSRPNWAVELSQANPSYVWAHVEPGETIRIPQAWPQPFWNAESGEAGDPPVSALAKRIYPALGGETPQSIAAKFDALGRPNWAAELRAANPTYVWAHVESGDRIAIPDAWTQPFWNGDAGADEGEGAGDGSMWDVFVLTGQHDEEGNLGRQLGTVSKAELRARVVRGEAGAATRVRRAGTEEDAYPISHYPELADILATPTIAPDEQPEPSAPGAPAPRKHGGDGAKTGAAGGAHGAPARPRTGPGESAKRSTTLTKRSYVIKAGDTPSKIAKLAGPKATWKDLIKVNPHKTLDPAIGFKTFAVGEIINIPDIDTWLDKPGMYRQDVAPPPSAAPAPPVLAKQPSEPAKPAKPGVLLQAPPPAAPRAAPPIAPPIAPPGGVPMAAGPTRRTYVVTAADLKDPLSVATRAGVGMLQVHDLEAVNPGKSPANLHVGDRLNVPDNWPERPGMYDEFGRGEGAIAAPPAKVVMVAPVATPPRATRIPWQHPPDGPMPPRRSRDGAPPPPVPMALVPITATIDPGALQRVQAMLATWTLAHPRHADPKDFGTERPISPDTRGVWTARTQQALAAFQRWANAGRIGEQLRARGIGRLLESGKLDEVSSHVLNLWAQSMLNKGVPPTDQDVDVWVRGSERPRIAVQPGRRARQILAADLDVRDRLVADLRRQLEQAVASGAATAALEEALHHANRARAAAEAALRNAGITQTALAATADRAKAEADRLAHELFEKNRIAAALAAQAKADGASDQARADAARADREHRAAQAAASKARADHRAAEEALHRSPPASETVPFPIETPAPPKAGKVTIAPPELPPAMVATKTTTKTGDDGGLGTALSVLGLVATAAALL